MACSTADFWINICLYILGWIPGGACHLQWEGREGADAFENAVIHAWWLISKHEKPAVVVAHHQQQHYGSTAQGAYTAVPAPAQPQYGAKPATGAQY